MVVTNFEVVGVSSDQYSLLKYYQSMPVEVNIIVKFMKTAVKLPRSNNHEDSFDNWFTEK